MNSTQLLATLRSERAKLAALLDAVGIERMHIPGVSGSYATKDVVAHITAYERALVTWLSEAKAGRVYVDSVLDQADLDARNAALYEANQRRSATDIVEAFHETFDELEQCVALLTDEELDNTELTAWFVAPRWGRPQPLWQCIANDSYEHHHQHIPDIERWLAQNASVRDQS